jgi:hypothetical protein
LRLGAVVEVVVQVDALVAKVLVVLGAVVVLTPIDFLKPLVLDQQ